MMNLDGEILYIISLSILTIISLIVSFKRRGNRELAGRFLVVYFWAYWYTMLVSYLLLYKYLISVPHLIRTGQLIVHLLFPASYVYVLQTLAPRRLKWSDLLHFVPALIYLVDYFPFFILTGQAKIRLMEQLDATQLRIGYAEGWFMPQYGHYIIRTFQFFGYSIAQILLIAKVVRSPEHPLVFGKPQVIRWISLLVTSQCLLFIMPLIAGFFGNTREIAIFSNIPAHIAILMQGLYLLFNPEILYGVLEYFQDPQAPVKEGLSARSGVFTREVSAHPEIVSEASLDKVDKDLSTFMQLKKPFLKPGYKLLDLSDDTGIPVYKISAYVNRRRKQNFSGYLNQYRLNQFLEKIDSREYESKTLEAIAEECGFHSRSSFIRVFKSAKGMTPSEYIWKH